MGVIRALLSALLCAILIPAYVLQIHPDSLTGWDASTIGAWTTTLFAPLSLAAWSVVAARPSGRASLLRWARIFITWHFVLILLAVGLLWGYFSLRLLGYLSSLDVAFAVFVLIPTVIGFSPGALATDLLLLAVGPPASSSPTVLRIYRTSILALCSAGLIVLFIWSFATIGLLVRQAEAVSGASRYCMMIPIDGQNHYRPITSLLDLRGLKLLGPVGPRLVLITATSQDPIYGSNGEERDLEFSQWSHRKQRFIVMGRPADFSNDGIILPFRHLCTPSTNFAGRLPILSSDGETAKADPGERSGSGIFNGLKAVPRRD